MATRGKRGEWSVLEVTRATGTTSRTLRHYDAIGLLTPSRVGAGGVRHYDTAALVRLQRILVLRELGLPLAAIGRVLDGQADQVTALRRHLDELRTEQHRLTRIIVSVERTIDTLERGGPIVAEEMFDGFDHTKYRDEVSRRWGTDAYVAGDRWWRNMTDADRTAWGEVAARLSADWTAAAQDGVTAESDRAQNLAQRHAAWLRSIPGTPSSDGQPDREYLIGLGELYVADERFAANYGGVEGAALVRDALRVWADRAR